MEHVAQWRAAHETHELVRALDAPLVAARAESASGETPAAWGLLQHALLTDLLVTWAPALEAAGRLDAVLKSYFYPEDADFVHVHTLATCTDLLAARTTLHDATRDALARVLLRLDPAALVAHVLRSTAGDARHEWLWRDAVAQMVALPARVANAAGAWAADAPRGETPTAALADAYARWPAQLAAGIDAALDVARAPALAVLVTRLARTGHVAAPAFWDTLVPRMLARREETADAWAALYASLDESVQDGYLVALVRALDAHMATTPYAWPVAGAEHAPGAEGRAFLSEAALAHARAAYAALAIAAGRTAEGRVDVAQHARTPLLGVALGAWLAEERGALADVLSLWCARARIARASARHEETLVAMLLAAARGASDTLTHWAHTPAFLEGVAAHLDHSDPGLRRLGMLVAEVVSAATDTPVRFPPSVWDGRGEGREAARVLRALWESAWRVDVGAIAWAPPNAAAPSRRAAAEPRRPPASVRLPRRAPARPLVQEITPAAPAAPAMPPETPLVYPSDDVPTQRPPVYVYELVPLVREHNYDANRLALQHAEALIRRKTNWGGEVAEHGVDLAIALAAMQDSFDMAEFEERRTGALTALCVAAPAPVVEYVV